MVKFDPKTPDDLRCDEYPVLALKEEMLVDTNGAGDSFVGGFLA